MTVPDVTVEKTRLDESDWAKTYEKMAKKAARARKGDENFIVICATQIQTYEQRMKDKLTTGGYSTRRSDVEQSYTRYVG